MQHCRLRCMHPGASLAGRLAPVTAPVSCLASSISKASSHWARHGCCDAWQGHAGMSVASCIAVVCKRFHESIGERLMGSNDRAGAKRSARGKARGLYCRDGQRGRTCTGTLSAHNISPKLSDCICIAAVHTSLLKHCPADTWCSSCNPGKSLSPAGHDKGFQYVQGLQVAVVDEIQMMADPLRGHAFTSALLGLPAQQLHVCGDPAAWPLLQKIVSETGQPAPGTCMLLQPAASQLL